MELVAGDGFCGLFGGLGSRGSAAVRVAVAIRRRDRDRLACVGEVRRDSLGDIAYGPNLHYGLLGLLQNQLFVNGADLSLFFKSFLAAEAVFFGGGHRNVVLDVTNTGGIFGV